MPVAGRGRPVGVCIMASAAVMEEEQDYVLKPEKVWPRGRQQGWHVNLGARGGERGIAGLLFLCVLLFCIPGATPFGLEPLPGVVHPRWEGAWPGILWWVRRLLSLSVVR